MRCSATEHVAQRDSAAVLSTRGSTVGMVHFASLLRLLAPPDVELAPQASDLECGYQAVSIEGGD
jgi:hypothetical protein